jgi:hypothetical protein
MKIRSIRLKDYRFGDQWATEIEDRWEYSDFKNTPSWRENWISFDCLCHDPVSDTVFTGITSFDADIFRGWSRGDTKWIDPDYGRVRDEYDAKFHRSLVLDSRDGVLYGAVALLHNIDRFWDAPGGAIVRYDPADNSIAKLSIPMPHVYIQSIVLDERRDTIYGQTFTPEHLVSYNLKSGLSRWIGPTSSGFCMAQGENIVLDDTGCVWGSWTVTRAWQNDPGVDQYRLYKFDPLEDRIVYMDSGLPRIDGGDGFEKPEGFFNFGTGVLYVSGGEGGLYRVDPVTAKAEFLFKAVSDEGRGRRSRLASMRLGPDGYAYGVVGRDGECELLKFDPRDESYELIGRIAESNVGESNGGDSAWQIHDVCVTPDGVLYAGENDNPNRSGYLWEVELDS